jgi:hypothetical protein
VTLVLLAAAPLVDRPAAAQIDLSGEWVCQLHEDRPYRRDPPGPDVGDYTGLPINDANRLRADSYDASIYSVPEHQTQPATAMYADRAASDMRISKVIDDDTQQVVAFKIYRAPFAGTTRMIWMDGRAHPPEYAAHTFQGFSTGTWQGNTLVVETTHVKNGSIQRNGVVHSDRATMTEYFFRHGDNLTIVNIVNDPQYLEEPFIRSSNFVIDTTQQLDPVPFQVVGEIAGRPEGYVPHYLPGANTQLKEFAERYGLPFEATRGGKDTTYPEYQQRLKELMAKPKGTATR